MAEPRNCPDCGCEVTPDSPSGLCPNCLLGQALDSHVDPPETPKGKNLDVTTPQPGGFVPPIPSSLAAHFPQLELLELLGHGGMGAVYKARQTKLDRLVALKIIRPESADDPAFAERFNREARTLARLNHPNIVAVHDFGEVQVTEAGDGDGKSRTLYYFLMEYVDGADLRHLISSGELSPDQALAVIPQICEALQYAHDEDIIHRDIKPENILVDRRGRVKIADFGLARIVAASPQDFTLTATHQVMGTPRYMAPEQLSGAHQVDHRADIYSLGVVFYEMLTGVVPMGQFEPPSKRAEVDARLDEIVMRALASEPERRFQHASEISSQVNAIRGVFSSGSMESIYEIRNPWPGASTIFNGAAGRIAEGVRGGALSRFLAAPAVPGILTLLLCVGGMISTFYPWGFVTGLHPISQKYIYAKDHEGGIFAGILLFTLALVMLATTTKTKRLSWRPWAILLCSAAALLSLMFFYEFSFRNPSVLGKGGFFAVLGFTVAIVIVGVWDLRYLLHSPVNPATAAATRKRSIDADSRRPIRTQTGRDWVTLTRHQVENDLLPDICMVCGTPTQNRVNKTFGFAKYFKTKEMRVSCPMCPRHRGHWRNLVLTASIGWLLMFSLASVGMLVGMAISPRHGGPWAAGAGIGFFVGLGVYLGTVIYLACTRVTVESITDNEIRFRRVSAAFANAVSGIASHGPVISPIRPSEVNPVPAHHVAEPSSEQHAAPSIPSLNFDERRIEMQLKGHAAGLIISAVLGILFWGFVGATVFIDGLRALQSRGGLPEQVILWSIAVPLIVLVVAATMIAGAVKMSRVRGYEWCVAAAILAAIPWSGLAMIVSVPVGLWTISTLRREDVKNAFLARSVWER